LPEINSQTSAQLRAIVDYIQAQKARYLNLILVRQGKELYELDFANQLAEDKNNDNMSYVDYLCAIHRMIQNEITQRTHDHPVGLWTTR
jgi:protein transport protein SEC24